LLKQNWQKSNFVGKFTEQNLAIYIYDWPQSPVGLEQRRFILI